MRRLHFLALAVWILLGVPMSARADLAGDIARVLSDKLLANGRAGVEIVRLGQTPDQSQLIYQFNSHGLFIPASNMKVVTTSAALAMLGKDFRFRTMLFRHGNNLVLIGDGDPTLGDAEALKKVGWDVDTVFKTWAAGLPQRGVTSADNLLVDDSVFDDEFVNPDWPADQLDKKYEAEVAGLNLNCNCLDFYVRPTGAGRLVAFATDPATDYVTVKNTCVAGGENAIGLSREIGGNDLILRGTAHAANEAPVSVTIHDPPLFAGSVLAQTLQSAGIRLTGEIRRDRTARAAAAKAVATHDPSWTLLAVHETPLLDVVSRANKDSMNLYAECICKRLGFATSGEGSWAAGTAASAKFLGSLGISADEYRLTDGCGLSKADAVTPHLMVTVLAHDMLGPIGPDWLKCLAVAGEDGTLADRFHGTSLRGRVIAKTGHVNTVSSLSGYLHARDDNWYAFSILFNGIPAGTNILEERIVEAVDQSAGK